MYAGQLGILTPRRVTDFLKRAGVLRNSPLPSGVHALKEICSSVSGVIDTQPYRAKDVK